jgi:hypothetical protein
MKNQDLKWLRKITNVLYCVDSDLLSYEDLISGSYDEQLRTHMNTDAQEMLNTLSSSEWSYIKRKIDIENDFRKVMFID